MSQRQRHGLWIALIACLVIGVGGLVATPVARLALNEIDRSDPLGALLLALHPNNVSFHPYFYTSMKTAFDTMLGQLGPDEDRLYVVITGDEQYRLERERLRLNMRVWAYPRQIARWCLLPEREGMPRCNLPTELPVVTWRIDSLPGYTCDQIGEELRLCRSSE